MRYSLLSLVQAVLSSMDSDEINSVLDTEEAQQVVRIVQAVYFDIVERSNLPENYSLVNLLASGDDTQPVLMSLPSDVNKVVWLKYDKRTVDDTVALYRPLEWKPLNDFLEAVLSYDTTDTTNFGVMTVTDGGNTFISPYRKGVAPTFYTTYNDKTLLFDSYDPGVDTTLQSSKTLAYCAKSIPFVVSDTFNFPKLDDPQFPLLLNECKSLAWAELKQAQHIKAEVNARRGWTHLQNSKKAVDKTKFVNTLPNYGRK